MTMLARSSRAAVAAAMMLLGMKAWWDGVCPEHIENAQY